MRSILLVLPALAFAEEAQSVGDTLEPLFMNYILPVVAAILGVKLFLNYLARRAKTTKESYASRYVKKKLSKIEIKKDTQEREEKVHEFQAARSGLLKDEMGDTIESESLYRDYVRDLLLDVGYEVYEPKECTYGFFAIRDGAILFAACKISGKKDNPFLDASALKEVVLEAKELGAPRSYDEFQTVFYMPKYIFDKSAYLFVISSASKARYEVLRYFVDPIKREAIRATLA